MHLLVVVVAITHFKTNDFTLFANKTYRLLFLGHFCLLLDSKTFDFFLRWKWNRTALVTMMQTFVVLRRFITIVTRAGSVRLFLRFKLGPSSHEQACHECKVLLLTNVRVWGQLFGTWYMVEWTRWQFYGRTWKDSSFRADRTSLPSNFQETALHFAYPEKISNFSLCIAKQCLHDLLGL